MDCSLLCFRDCTGFHLASVKAKFKAKVIVYLLWHTDQSDGWDGFYKRERQENDFPCVGVATRYSAFLTLMIIHIAAPPSHRRAWRAVPGCNTPAVRRM